MAVAPVVATFLHIILSLSSPFQYNKISISSRRLTSAPRLIMMELTFALAMTYLPPASCHNDRVSLGGTQLSLIAPPLTSGIEEIGHLSIYDT